MEIIGYITKHWPITVLHHQLMIGLVSFSFQVGEEGFEATFQVIMQDLTSKVPSTISPSTTSEETSQALKAITDILALSLHQFLEGEQLPRFTTAMDVLFDVKYFAQNKAFIIRKKIG